MPSLSIKYFDLPFGKPIPGDALRYYLVQRTGDNRIYVAMREDTRDAPDSWDSAEKAASSANLFRAFYHVQIDGMILLKPDGSHYFFDLPGSEAPCMQYDDAGSW